jgi:hypothetical protein
MPVDTQPQDKPAAVRFHFDSQENGLSMTCTLIASAEGDPYRIEGGAPHFPSRDAFKAKVVAVGMSPAVAEDESRSFNATARQLRELGFSVQVKEEEKRAA